MERMIGIEKRKMIMAARKRGLTVAAICAAYGVKANAVFRLQRLEKETGDIVPRTGMCGRKSALSPEQITRVREMVIAENDIALGEIKERMGLCVSIPALHKIIRKLGFTYKKRVYTQASVIGRT
jgi:transposase